MYIRAFINKPLVRNTAKMSVSNIIMYLLPIVVTPILSRLYTPTSFGEWGIFSSAVSIISVVLFGGYDNVIVKTANKKETLSSVALCLAIGCIVTVVVSFGFYALRLCGIHFFEIFPETEAFTLYLLFSVFYTVLYNICNKSERYGVLSACGLVNGGAQAFFRISFAFVCLSVNGLIIGTTMSMLASVLFLLAFCIKDIKCKELESLCWNDIKGLAVRYRRFPLYDAPSSLLSFATFNLPVIILSLYFCRDDIGCFSIVLQLLLLPMSFIGSAIGRVYYQQLCKEPFSTSAFPHIQSITEDIIKITTIISILPLAFISLGGDKIIVAFLGEQWHTAGNVALCLSLWSFPTILTQPLLPLFRYLEKLRTMLLFDMAYFTFGIGCLLIGCLTCDDIETILIFFSLSCCIVKMSLFSKILSLSGNSLKKNKRTIALWSASLLVLTIRLCLI